MKYSCQASTRKEWNGKRGSGKTEMTIYSLFFLTSGKYGMK